MELNCEFEIYAWARTEVDYYGCGITEEPIIQPGTAIKAFIGEHQEGFTNFDVEMISFLEKISIEYLPRGLSKIFPNLKALDIDSCGLKKITRNDLTGLENLEAFCINNSKLRSLPSDLFEGMTKLKEISLCDNKLEFLSSQLLEAIAGNQLERVDFRSNTKIDAFYQPGEEGSVASLQELMEIIDKDCESPENDEDEEEEFMRSFAAGFKDLWTTKDFSDFRIIGGFDGSSKEFAVHKIVLATQSDVFAAVLKNDNMKEAQTGTMTIDDFSADTVEGMLQFMYTGQIKKLVAMDLYAIASRYHVKNLKSRTEKIMLRNIDETNALEVFGLGHQYNSIKMKLAAFEEIKKMFPNTPLRDELMTKPENLKEIVNAGRERKKIVEEAEQNYLAKLQKFA
jgi:BTB/POZ domain/Leucine rich repeat